jgi:predicted PurR-regulated permease PerM
MNPERLEKPFFMVMLICAIVLALFVFLPELNVLVLGAAFAIFFHPIYVRIRRGMPQYDGLAAFFTLLIAAIVIVVPLAFFGYDLFSEAQGLYMHLAAGGIPSLENLIGGKLGSVMSNLQQSGGAFTFFNLNVSQYITQAAGTVVANAGKILSSIGVVAWTFFLAFFVFYYLLKDGGKFRQLIVRGLPLKDTRADDIVGRLVTMAISVVRGSILMAIAWGVIVGLEFFAFGISNPVLWGAIAIPVAFVPVIGVSLIIIPGILYVGLVAGLVKAIIFAIVAFIISAFMGNILYPRVIGHGRNIHPLLLLLSVLGGLSFFGPIGLFLGPLVLSLSLTLFEVYPTLIADQ